MVITIDQANRVLDILNYTGFHVVDIYEDSFRAIMDDEFCMCELNVTFIGEPEYVTRSNYYYYTNHVLHVLKRHKGG